MEFLPEAISEYVESYTSVSPALLDKLDRETNAKVLMPRMLSGHLQGRVLSMLSKMVQPDNILEVGTYTGYSALCLAEGLTPKGVLHTIDINEELREMCLRYFKEAGMGEKIKTHTGNALEIIPTIAGTFDMVFIDADKNNYANYYNMVMDRVRQGGYIIADNVLWSGNVLQDTKDMDEDTRGIVHFNNMVMADDRTENVMIPVRDGLMVIRKK